MSKTCFVLLLGQVRCAISFHRQAKINQQAFQQSVIYVICERDMGEYRLYKMKPILVVTGP